MARNKGPGYKPDPFLKVIDGFMKKLVRPQEKFIYVVAVLLLAVLVVSWVVASQRRTSSEDALNALAAARKSTDESAVETVLRDNASSRNMVPYILQHANQKYLNALMGRENTDKAALIGKAEEFFRMIDDYNPEHPMAFLAFAGIACCREENGDNESALKYFRKALAAAPHEMKDKFSYDVGRLLVALDRKSEAVRFLRDATLGEKVYDANLPGGDYEWRLNARQLLAEVEDEEGSEPLDVPPPDAGPAETPVEIPDEPVVVIDDGTEAPPPAPDTEVVE
ncbi:MAG: hypothetical protein JW909_13255 [Planctomycetes bacterium]|nr:hypothetical protein [Planctomycetota bacterium]